MKRCPKCGRVLPADMFAPHSRNCKLCRRDYDWQYRYGLSPKQYLEMYCKQDGKCAICGNTLPKEDGKEAYFDVDHDKATGEVRGLLCGSCNRGLGSFRDNPEFLRSAARYLEENNAGV